MFTVNHVTLRGTDRPRLNDVSLTISARRTAVMGYSGAGKTSLLNLLAGFETPDGGTISTTAPTSLPRIPKAVSEYSPVGSLGPAADRIPIFWVPQNGGLWPHLSAEQHLLSVNKSKELADEILSSLDLNHREAAFPDELSQGERSRLSLARALASNADVLLMDEPLSHVDPVRKPGYWDVVTRLTERFSSSIVFTSHEPETVLRRSDSVICLHEGAVAFQGPTRDLYDSPPSAFLAEFLGPVNWFTLEEIQYFGIRVDRASGMAIRPERLSVAANGTGEGEYIKCLFDGPYSESLIRIVTSGASRIIKHQRPEVPLQEGVRVSLVWR
jgi:ABC-type branched-subunit amino acid transport system ATPase component